MYYTDLLRQRIIPTREIPLPGGGVGRRRCDGYQWPCSEEAANMPPVIPHPTDCPPGYQITLSNYNQLYWGTDEVTDCGSITVQTGCPSIQEGLVTQTAEDELDLGRL